MRRGLSEVVAKRVWQAAASKEGVGLRLCGTTAGVAIAAAVGARVAALRVGARSLEVNTPRKNEVEVMDVDVDVVVVVVT